MTKNNLPGNPHINYGKKLAVWKTIEKTNPGKLIVWELNIDGQIDLLVYNKNTLVADIAFDIENYYKKPIENLKNCTLRPLTKEEVLERFCK